ncbi:MAG: EpsI family protein [Methylomarinum sp.]|nr:EpsI family protein [Methylomarinum sp.]
MASIWIRSETFTHCFFVIPASLWLVWQNKTIHPFLHAHKPSFIALGFLLINGLLWLLASITQTLVIQQYALIGMLIGSLWFYFGNDIIKKTIFPISFLYFMVPVGEALLPYLMEYTATFTISLLRLTGLSVYREGMHFSLISGDWSVVEACGGLRYLLASITLGVIFAYTTFTKLHKRIIFCLFSAILPIIANGFRAYIIVMIGHLSDMKLAVGVDHLIYGAIFFGIIIFFMFYIGSIWKDPTPDIKLTNNSEIKIKSYTAKKTYLLAFTVTLSLSLWPLLAAQLQSKYQAQTDIPEWPLQIKRQSWQEIDAPDWSWKPKFNNVINESLRYFKNGNVIIGLYQANFGDEQHGAELVNSNNVLRRINISKNLNERKLWHFIDQSAIHIKKLQSSINFAILRNNKSNEDIYILKWYQVGNTLTNNDFMAKFHQLVKRLTLNNEPEIYNIIFTLQPTSHISSNNKKTFIHSFFNTAN